MSVTILEILIFNGSILYFSVDILELLNIIPLVWTLRFLIFPL